MGRRARRRPGRPADPRALAEVVGPAPVVDELPDDGRARLGRVTSLVTRAELGEPDGR